MLALGGTRPVMARPVTARQHVGRVNLAPRQRTAAHAAVSVEAVRAKTPEQLNDPAHIGAKGVKRVRVQVKGWGSRFAGQGLGLKSSSVRGRLLALRRTPAATPLCPPT